MSVFKLNLYLKPEVNKLDVKNFIEVIFPNDEEMLINYFEIMENYDEDLINPWCSFNERYISDSFVAIYLDADFNFKKIKNLLQHIDNLIKVGFHKYISKFELTLDDEVLNRLNND